MTQLKLKKKMNKSKKDCLSNQYITCFRKNLKKKKKPSLEEQIKENSQKIKNQRKKLKE